MTQEAVDAILALSGAHATIVKALDRRLGGHGLSYAEVRLLSALAVQPAKTLRAGELAHELGLSASGVTRAILPLEKRGIVAREPDPNDARASRIRLSEAGARLHSEASQTIEESADALMRRLSVGQIRQLERLLGEIGAVPAKGGGSR